MRAKPVFLYRLSCAEDLSITGKVEPSGGNIPDTVEASVIICRLPAAVCLLLSVHVWSDPNKNRDERTMCFRGRWIRSNTE
uniref:Uncharacterized protein n=1 Tax=Anopheles stephensi TaxID=30069 RepID=A0A182YEH2_ANOST